MRVPLILALVTFVLVASGTPSSAYNDITNVEMDVKRLFRRLSVDSYKVKRVLRQYDFNELSGPDSVDEERAVVDKVDDIVNKADDIVGKANKIPKNLNAAVEKAVMTVEDTVTVAKNVAKYPKHLSVATMNQIQKVEQLRLRDVATYSKETGKSMRREIVPFEGIKIVPDKYLVSNHGRVQQRWSEDNSKRLLSSAVVSRPESLGGGDVLLISSSNPTKNDWLLPKGGWDHGENIEHAALREVIEEGGVNAKLLHNLGTMSEDEHAYYFYMMQAKTVYDDWAESARYRLWVSYDDAMKLLQKRPKMVEMVEKAKTTDDLVKNNKLLPADEALEKITLPGINEAT
ncbi:RxLR effector protein [Phytophthora megakarya]|uniref:RxLR effector protein n=1 Tax=Phytophthora megakarya TaxID=4795 RepID=A0A225WGE7_9STRA|nr:RxLR effector protein [Phytophthora megakarya]